MYPGGAQELSGVDRSAQGWAGVLRGGQGCSGGVGRSAQRWAGVPSGGQGCPGVPKGAQEASPRGGAGPFSGTPIDVLKR